MHQGEGQPQQTEGVAAEQQPAKHPAAFSEEKKKKANLHCNSHNPDPIRSSGRMKHETEPVSFVIFSNPNNFSKTSLSNLTRKSN